MIVEQAAKRLALPIPYLLKVATTASYRYKEYTIPKKSGGVRIIHHPAKELKLLQGWLLHGPLAALPVHDAATAYRVGIGIRQNAEKHVSSDYILRVDFQDFFPSLHDRDVASVLETNRRKMGDSITDVDLFFINRIVCRGSSLTIGAPTSPHLSNTIMFNFDTEWSERARALDVTYTRYADDLYFSTNHPNVLENLLQELRDYLRGQVSPTLRINERKTAFSSRKRRRLMAGLILTSDRKISIGRHRKRVIKGLVMKLMRQQLQAGDIGTLRGWVSYLASVEPSFVFALERKYGVDFSDSKTWQT